MELPCRTCLILPICRNKSKTSVGTLKLLDCTFRNDYVFEKGNVIAEIRLAEFWKVMDESKKDEITL